MDVLWECTALSLTIASLAGKLTQGDRGVWHEPGAA